MTSSGIKRGLAATAISALAITGIPALASPASAESNNAQFPAVTFLSQSEGQASVKNDGTDTTVRLEAAAPADVPSITFQYTVGGGTPQTITTVNRNDDGAFSFEWTVPSALIGASVVLSATGTPTTAPSVPQTDTAAATINGAGAAGIESYNLTEGTNKGYYVDPFSAAINVAVSGTTSLTSGTVDVASLVGGTVAAPVSAPATASTGTFAGVVDIAGYTFGSANELLFRAGNTADSDDVESYTLYAQNITTVEAVAKDATKPLGTTTTVTVTVKDQSGLPIAGANVQSSAGGTQTTNGKGQATFTQDAGSTNYYYANTTATPGYQAGVDKRSTDVTVGTFAAAPTSLVGTSDDGAAFDLDEYTGGDITVQVKDQNGGDYDIADNQDLNYHWVITPFDGTPATQRVPATGEATVTTDTNGEFEVPLPAATDPSGTYELFASIPPNSGTGTGAIAESKVLTFKAGQAKVSYAPAGDQSAEAGGQVDLTGTLALEDGTVLGARNVEVSFTRGTIGTDPAKDAGIVPATGTALVLARTFKTAADGTFAVTVDDPAETPQGTEVGGQLSSQITGVVGATTVGINFASASAPAGTTDIKVVVNDNAATNKPGVATAPNTVTVTGDPDGAGVAPVGPIAGVAVTVTVDSDGFFTTGEPTPTPTTGEKGDLVDSGDTVTVVTNASGEATIPAVGIGRSEDFDDDGEAAVTVTATFAGATDSDEYDFDSANPLNGGDVELVPSERQENAIDPTPVDDRVFYEVIVTDQFGNRVGGESVDLSEDDFDVYLSTNSVTSDFSEADRDFYVYADEPTTAAVTATWDAPRSAYNNPGTVTKTLTDTADVEFYEVDYDAATITFGQIGPENVPVGARVTEKVTVLDQNGRPVQGVYVEFLRSGPSNEDSDGNDNDFTGEDGSAYYDFVGGSAGEATITAVLSTDDYAGTRITSLTDTVTFGAKADIVAKTKGKNNGGKNDKVKIVTAPRGAAAGAKVILFKVKGNETGNKKTRVGVKSLNAKGKAKFIVKDMNGGKKTRYFARVKPTATTLGARSNNRGLR